MLNKNQENELQMLLNEPIAIVGMNCQFPGVGADVADVQALFDMLLQGQSPIKEIPASRWDLDAYYDPEREKADKMVGRKGGFLTNPELFDAAFFKLSAIESKQIDPQHRLFLEVAIRALNHANIRLDSLKNSATGVYCGSASQDYSQLNYKDNIEFNAYSIIGAASSAAAGRLSHFLDLKGPCMAVDTACSSSLTALYLAVNALRTGECSLAIAGGVHLSLCPESFISVSRANMLSAADRCSSFDASADGYVRSEGCAVIVVKRLSDALRDKDRIFALIKSIVMNQDGDDGTQLVAPNLKAQIAMHEAALSQARLQAGDIAYVEAHGTGTIVGDAVEFNAIQAVHQGQHSEKPLVIGALKSNLGHSLASSGLASLIKAVAALENEKIPRNLHYAKPAKRIHPEAIPAIFPDKTLAFVRDKMKKRYVQVANYGFTGTNVSAILEEAPEPLYYDSRSEEGKPFCFVLSANSEASLKQMLASYPAFLRSSSASLKDLCLSLINCRDHYKFRTALLVKDKNALLARLEAQDYELHKVQLHEEPKSVSGEAQDIYEAYLAGSNISLAQPHNKVDLPLYAFDRKPYWHEARFKPAQPEPVAIIGMACRMPKAANVREFLSLLERGESGMVDIPLERWDNEKYYDADPNAFGHLYIKQLGFIEPVKTFDADFFNVSPREARVMAPQLRVFMETSYHALEDANLALDRIRNSKTGVFVGCGTNEYPRYLFNQGFSLENLNIYFATGNVLNAIPGRVAYSFDFNGPVQAIDTACSSSMTAIHNACLSLEAGDCDLALAGGVNILLLPESNITLSKAKMLSPDSRCKTFSEDANGYARSEGCGVIVLKRLSSALRDGDRVLAVIKGSAINSDGKSGGFTVPNGMAQERVIRAALAKAQLSPADVDYIEAHGTGTPLADPIEVQTLTRIFSGFHSQENPLYLSSVKTNIGHCESASGVAGVIKTVLSLQSKKIFKHLNFKKLNPEIDLKNTLIPLQTMPWPDKPGLRCAGVSSFGFSGANGHLLLQEAPAEAKEGRERPEESLLLLSAKSQKSLELLLASYQSYLATTTEDFADICYTAATCRSHFLFRVAIKAKSSKEAAEVIRQEQYSIHQLKKERKTGTTLSGLDQLQAAYEEGLKINWLACYQALALPFAKVQLPLYEFNRVEYWFNEQDKLKDVPLPRNWCFQLQWQAQAYEGKNWRKAEANWLLIGAEHLAPQLHALGLRISLEEEDLTKVEGILFAAPQSDELFFEKQKASLKKLLNLLKTLNQQALSPRLVVLTAKACAELKADKFNLAASPLTGFCKTLALELPQFETVLIDLDKDNLAPLLTEINYNHGDYYEQLVAYREGKRLVARLKKTPLPEEKIPLSNNGRYLISGGCGGLGLVTAQALLASGARDLILLARQIDSPRIDAIKRMEQAYPGARIRALALDITDREKLAALFVELNADGLLKGIVHAAGAAVKASLLEHQDKDVDYLFSAKVRGGWNLHELSKSCQLDFFLVYSSIASVFGSNLESVYSGANSFLDALIAERRRLGLPGSAIQWGPWAEVGMAKERSRSEDLKPALIDKERGYSFIKLFLQGQESHRTIISPDYLKFMLAFAPKPLSLFHKALQDELDGSETKAQPNLSPWLGSYAELAKEERLEACKNLLTGLCREILELPESEVLGEDEGFFELGFDSLMITELAARLKKVLEPLLKVTVSIGFNYPSIGLMAAYIEEELAALRPEEALQAPSEEPVSDDSIAIIGMSCVLPSAPDLTAFSQLLEEGLSGIREIPIERWDNSKYYDPNPEVPSKSYVSKLGLLDNIKDFDANFFGISPREAKLLEPQQRIFLECCYQALEQANYPPAALAGSLTGVYAGVGPNEFYALLEKSGFSSEELSVYSITGNVLNLIPGRVAYTFDLKGPSLSVDTACSSSLVAVHYACQGLRNHEIDYAFAGGVNILLMPESNITLCKAKALAPDGQCKTFDERADGYARGEGGGVVLLKRTVDAIRDGDQILAVIKASAVNNDGKSAGLVVPNGQSQEAVMQQALSQSGLAPEDLDYIEAHGTGTPLGDPIEVQAINAVYGKGRGSDNPLYLGTVKTNIGHLESAAGIAGLIKTVLGLQRKKIYKLLNFNKLNPNIQLNGSQLALEKRVWPDRGRLKAAGINAFGFSGTNAHMILQEYPASKARPASRPAREQLLPLSAKSKDALELLIKDYQAYLQTTADDFGDICFTAATCRAHYNHRVVVSALDAVEASRKLAACHLDDSAVAELYLQGNPVDWSSHYQSQGQFNKVDLPHYHFDRSEFWPDKKAENRPQAEDFHPLVGQMLSLPGQEYLFSNKLDLQNLSYISQHEVFGKTVFPAVAYIESGLSVAKTLFKQDSFQLELFSIKRPLYPRQGQDLQIQAKPAAEEGYKLSIFARQADDWQDFAELQISPQVSLAPDSIDLASFFGEKVDLSEIYDNFKNRGLVYGAEFRVLQEGYLNPGSVFARVSLTKVSQAANYFYHPVLLDGAMQALLLLAMNSRENQTYVPYAFKRMTLLQRAPRSFWVQATIKPNAHKNELWVDLRFYDQAGLLIGELAELKFRVVSRANFVSYDYLLQHLYQTKWLALQDNQLPVIDPPASTTTSRGLSAGSNDGQRSLDPADKPRDVGRGTDLLRLPEFLVVAQDEERAKRLLGNLAYQFAQPSQSLAKQEVIYFYEQGAFNELFLCCQKLFKALPKRFILVTERAFALSEQDRVNPYHSMAASFWRSFSNELEFGDNYQVDLGEGGLLPALTYIFSPGSTEKQLASRERLYIPRLRRKQLAPSQDSSRILFDPEATYLIVGGTGGLAKLLIAYLRSAGVKKLILSSRSPCPQDIAEVIAKADIEIRHVVADACNYRAMAALVEGIDRLKGIFHLAGVVHDGLLVNLSEEDLQTTLNAKVESALHLHQLSKDLALDHFVLFSSSASVLGAAGQSNYAAANGFLDGLAHLRRQQGLAALAINWGPFHEQGMTAKLGQAMQQQGYIPLQKEDIEILDRLLQTPLTQIAPCPMNWELFCRSRPKQPWLSELVKTRPAAEQRFLNSLRQHNTEERVAILSQALGEISTEILALGEAGQIGGKDDLFALGFDSLMAIEIRNRLYDKLQCPRLSLPIEYFINEPTIENIALRTAESLAPILAESGQISLPQAAGEVVPLCDFQYLFWVLNKLGNSFNIGMQLRLQGRVSKDYLYQAFDAVVRQNAAFWIDFSEHAPLQKMQRTGRFELIFRDVSLADQTALDQEFRKNILSYIPLNQQPLIRIYFYKINNELGELHLVMPHIIVDDVSCEIVFSQFKSHYEALFQGKKPEVLAQNNSYFSYVKNNNFHYEKDLTEKINFWKNYNKGFKKLNFGPAYHLSGLLYQEKYLFHYRLDPQAIARFVDWHRSKNLNLSSGLIAVCQLVFYKLTQQKKMPFILIHSGREGAEYKATVGLFSEYKRINLQLEEGAKFSELVLAIEQELLKTAPFQKCSHFIKDAGLGGEKLSFSQYLSYRLHKFNLGEAFAVSKLNATILDFYLRHLSAFVTMSKKNLFKFRLSRFLGLKPPGQKPEGLRILLSITPSFFSKEAPLRSFADLDYSFPSHFGSSDRPIGNRALWVYFSKNQEGEYLLSINGPLTQVCKDQIAIDFNKILAELVKEG